VSEVRDLIVVRQQLRKGIRVRLNEAGMQQTNVLKNRSGVIVGFTRDRQACRVRWDGRRVAQPWFFEYLIPDPR
jgi:hypothetical protein